MHQKGRVALGLLSIFTVAVAGLGAGPAWAAPPHGHNPPGNNGTIKVDAAPFDDHPNNEPHVGCLFEIDFYGFDEGDLYADVIFDGHAPTGGGQLVPTDRVFIGQDDAGGGTDLDASKQYDLTTALAAITPHPQQGWHVKLTIHADGSQGADVKHKVFWVNGCQPGTTPLTPPPGGTTIEQVPPVVPPVVAQSVTPPVPPVPAEVLGVAFERTPQALPAAQPVEVQGIQFARTGTDARVLAMLAGLIIVLGRLLVLMVGPAAATAVRRD